ncbi:MarR family winged helix-turn-helix transcriptional regulator [Streptacidiphilus sp. P02-A3a]|uniref:MarR family winged helix-turn-helix transcriptional regulator n=1 Tax=Streptacidiphilus sp. P02-A3a TaxID=2704468 RepID=UPI0015FC0B7D|nr:MarR family winged helix-turn-helix transcriptional regulator [Streptacidiphilus sp. P02-A3a]QMU68090.1 winged helix-turn-helix transcriptional regulator [Streptacidiphilus sp. P02-A3a]
MDSTADSTADARALPALLLALSGELVAGIQAGVEARGFADIRPAHGFAFARLAPDGATVGELAEHLGVTKQAASQLVEELVRKGYVERHPHPDDARARLVVLTERGWACTRAADAAAADTIAPWIDTLGAARFHPLVADLARLSPRGPVRPTW